MDIFTLEQEGTTYKNGEIVNGLYKKLWVERYLEPGEFTLVGTPTRELRESLAIGTLISHTNSKEVMIVEDQQIEDGQNPVFTVTGRSFDSILESRVATDSGLGFNGPNNSGTAPLVLYDQTAWPYRFEDVTPPELVVELMRDQIGSDTGIRTTFRIPYIEISNAITTTYNSEDQDVPRGDLYTKIKDILDGIDAGIKVRRPDNSHEKIRVIVHKGTNRKDTVRFSYLRGEVTKAKYFWSTRNYRNAAYISTRYQGQYVVPASGSGLSGLDRRVMFIDATDVNKGETTAQKNLIKSVLQNRAKRELRKHRLKTVFEAEISPQNRYEFRKDYDVGDLVYVDGNYDVSAVMRVTEFVESDEGNGTVGIPTLEAVRVIDEETDSDIDIYTVEEKGGA